MADNRKATKRRAENLEFDGTMLKRPNFSEAKPENIKQAGNKRTVYIPSNRFISLATMVLELYVFRGLCISVIINISF